MAKAIITQTYPLAVEARVRCKPWTMYPMGMQRVEVYADGSVLVWDDVACHFTRAHSLSRRAERRIFRDVYPTTA